MTHPTTTDLSVPREFKLIREFDAPRSLVWQCWADAQHLAAWWGPQIMTNTVEQDFRPGGTQVITMMGPNGTTYPIKAIFLAIEPEDYFIGAMTTEDYDGDWKEQFKAWAGGASDGNLRLVMRVDFEELSPKRTRITMTQTFPTLAERDANVKLGAEAGWGESFVKLDAYLAAMLA